MFVLYCFDFMWRGLSGWLFDDLGYKVLDGFWFICCLRFIDRGSGGGGGVEGEGGEDEL